MDGGYEMEESPIRKVYVDKNEENKQQLNLLTVYRLRYMVKTAHSLNKFTKNFSTQNQYHFIGNASIKQKVTGLGKANITGKKQKMATILHKNTIISSYVKKEDNEQIAKNKQIELFEKFRTFEILPGTPICK